MFEPSISQRLCDRVANVQQFWIFDQGLRKVLGRSVGTADLEYWLVVKYRRKGKSMDFLQTLATVLTVALVTTLASAWLALPLALRRFRPEKWWEKRIDSYERVLTALAKTRESLIRHYEATVEGSNISDVEREELQRRCGHADNETATAEALSGFLLSADARSRLRKFDEERKSAVPHNNWVAFLEDSLDATDSCVSDLKHIAETELELRPD